MNKITSEGQPSQFQLYGHHAQQAQFLGGFQQGRMHHGWLLSGSKGIGKASFALMAAKHMMSRTPDHPGNRFDPDPTNRNVQLIERAQHPDCLQIARAPKDDKEARKQADGKPFDLARNIRVSQIRAMQARFATRASLADRRVIIIDSADDMEKGAANALLKSLEEPPRDTLFFLISHNPGRLLPTIRSRCLNLRFSALDDMEMRAALAQHDRSLGDAELASLVEMGGGAPGQALRFTGQDISRLVRQMEQIAQSGDRGFTGRTALAAMVAGKANKERFSALLELAPQLAARHIRNHSAQLQLDRAVDARAEIVRLARLAAPLNLDPQSTAFQIGGLLAQLAAVKAN